MATLPKEQTTITNNDSNLKEQPICIENFVNIIDLKSFLHGRKPQSMILLRKFICF